MFSLHKTLEEGSDGKLGKDRLHSAANTANYSDANVRYIQ